MTDKIEVTQADRDAAQLVCEYFNWLTIPDEAVQIIARHAHAARIEGARAALEAAAYQADLSGMSHPLGCAIAKAIRALDPEQIVKGMS